MTTKVSLDIVKFCARECQLQMSGEMSVGWMIDAWLYAQAQAAWQWHVDGPMYSRRPTVSDVLTIGRLCEPHDNLNGFRRCGVRIGQDIKIDWQVVPNQIDNLINHGTDLTPAEFFKEYEEIHPFEDGNGRSGQILFNWLNGTLNNPEWAPNFWADPRRTVGSGA